MKKLPLSYIELSKENLIYNIESLRSLSKKSTKFAVALKGNAYGHDLSDVAKIIEPYTDYFLLNSFEELKLLRKTSKKQVLLLGYVSKNLIEETIKLDCIMSVFSMEQFKEIEKVAKKLKIKQQVHISCDALLGREGFSRQDLPEFFTFAKNCSYVKITGLYSHFANIEDTNNFTHAKKQITEYKKILSLAEKFGYTKIDTHISATSGLLVYEKNKGFNNIVRIGIGMYGLWPSEHIEYIYKKNKFDLKPVLSWKTHVAQVRLLPAGKTIGYGLSFTTRKETQIALIPQGYADGFPRNLSNKGQVLIGGVKCKVLGRVSMNMFSVDITEVENVFEGDEVVIIGSQLGLTITVEDLALQSDTINYEVITRISPLLPRIVA